ILHRNLAPQNVLFCNGADVVKVGGLVGAPGRARPRSVEDLIYLAPERAEDPDFPGDHRSGLYSPRAVGYALLPRRPPFEADSPEGLVRKMQTMLPPPIHMLQPNVPPVLAIAVHRLLSRKPDDRFASAAELLSSLARG